jgi:hypothetical protein
VSCESKPAKILVFGEKDAAFGVSHLHQLLVNGPELKVAHGQDVVPSRTQGPDYGEIATLIREKSHPSRYSELTL